MKNLKMKPFQIYFSMAFASLRVFSAMSSVDLPIQKSTVFREIKRTVDGTTLVQDVFFESPMGGLVSAYLVSPLNKKTSRGVVYLHPASGNRDSLLKMAIEISRKTLSAGILIDAPFSRPEPWKKKGGVENPEIEEEILNQTLQDLQCSIDVLSVLLSESKKQTIAYIGKNFGAAIGAVLTEKEKRISGWVLIAGLPSMADFWLLSEHPEAKNLRDSSSPEKFKKFIQVTRTFDAIQFIGKASPSSLLFQFGLEDDWMNQEQVYHYFQTASHPKEILWYKTGHDFHNTQADQDRIVWLEKFFGNASQQ